MIAAADFQAPHAQAGIGSLRVSMVRGASVATTALSRTPVKLLTPRPIGQSVWAYSSSFGGGLVAGDDLRLDVCIDPSARCFLGTQSSTKVFRSCDGIGSTQALAATVGENAFLAVVPDPIQCFSGAIYAQKQFFSIERSSGLLFVDMLSAGRTARGERWIFDRFESSTEVLVNREQSLIEKLSLDARTPGPNPVDLMGKYNCMATILMVGEMISEAAKNAIDAIHATPLQRDASVLLSASPIRHGALIRVAAARIEDAITATRQQLHFMAEFLGDDPLLRKW